MDEIAELNKSESDTSQPLSQEYGSPKVKYKTPQQLESQVKATSNLLGEPLVPPSIDSQDNPDNPIYASENELKEKYPGRYDIYRDALVEMKNPGEKEAQIPDQERFEMGLWVNTLNRLDEYLSQEGNSENPTLRPKQMEVFSHLKTFLEKHKDIGHPPRGYIKLPTGVGKTVLFTEFAEATKSKTLIVVPRSLLLDQTVDKFAEFAPDLEIGKLVGGKNPNLSKLVTVTTYESLAMNVKNGNIKPEEIELLILDEAHRSLTDLRKDIAGRFTKAFQLGFTATPTFSEEKAVKQLLPNEIYNMPLKEAVEGGLVSPVQVIKAETEASLDGVSIQNGKYNEKELATALNIEGRNRAAVDLYKEKFMGKLGVAYCVGVEHAKRLAEMYQKAGINAVAVWGGQKEQKEVMEKFQKGEVQIICNADLLIEGFDAPQASVCLNLRPTMSRVVTEQRGGRVMRLSKSDPNKWAYIVEFVDKITNKKHAPVLFSDILGDNILHSKDITRQQAEEANPLLKDNNLTTQTEGLHVETSTELLAKVEQRKKEENPFAVPTWRTKEQIMDLLGIDSKYYDTVMDQIITSMHQWTNLETDKINPETQEREISPEAFKRLCIRRASAPLYELASRMKGDVIEKKLYDNWDKCIAGADKFFAIVKEIANGKSTLRPLRETTFGQAVLGKPKATSPKYA